MSRTNLETVYGFKFRADKSQISLREAAEQFGNLFDAEISEEELDNYTAVFIKLSLPATSKTFRLKKFKTFEERFDSLRISLKVGKDNRTKKAIRICEAQQIGGEAAISNLHCSDNMLSFSMDSKVAKKYQEGLFWNLVILIDKALPQDDRFLMANITVTPTAQARHLIGDISPSEIKFPLDDAGTQCSFLKELHRSEFSKMYDDLLKKMDSELNIDELTEGEKTVLPYVEKIRELLNTSANKAQKQTLSNLLDGLATKLSQFGGASYGASQLFGICEEIIKIAQQHNLLG